MGRPPLRYRWSYTCGQAAFAILTHPLIPLLRSGTLVVSLLNRYSRPFAGSFSGSPCFLWNDRHYAIAGHTPAAKPHLQFLPTPNPPPQEWDFGRFAPKSKFSTFCRELFRLSMFFYSIRSITLTPLSATSKNYNAIYVTSLPQTMHPTNSIGTLVHTF